MTQEILDCLWIKSLFIKFDEEQLLKNITDEKDLERLCRSICKVMYQEKTKFFYTSNDFIQKLEAILFYKRFSGKHSQELIDNFNKMVEAIQVYKYLSENEKRIIVSSWIKEEAEYRKLPYRKLGRYQSSEIQDIMLVDYYCMPYLLNDTNEKFDCEPDFFLNTINLLISEYPHIFYSRPDVFFRCMSICMQVELESMRISKRAEKTKKLLLEYEYNQAI